MEIGDIQKLLEKITIDGKNLGDPVVDITLFCVAKANRRRRINYIRGHQHGARGHQVARELVLTIA